MDSNKYYIDRGKWFAIARVQWSILRRSKWPIAPDPFPAKPNQAIEVRGPPSQPLNIGNESYFPVQNCKNAE